MKRMIAGMLCICLLLCNLVMIPRMRVQAKSVQLTSKSITMAKGQDIVVGVLNSKENATWSVSGENIKIKDTSESGYCYIKAKKTGTATLKCTVDQKVLKCTVKILPGAAFIGNFSDDQGEVNLNIYKSGKKYVAFYSQFRLAQMDWLTGTLKKGILTLKGSDPAGKPITVTVAKNGKKRIFTFQKTTWEYFHQGDTIELKKR